MEKEKAGLSNPAAVIAASEFANSDQGKKSIALATNAVKTLLIVGGTVLVGRYLWSQIKKWRAEKYARDNAGNPNLTAAAIIYNSFTRFGFPDSSFLSFLLPEFNISTDEDALYEIASKVTNVQSVSEAYKILFDRTLFFDVQKGLDSDEMRTFWNIINSPTSNQDTALYPIGTELYCAIRDGITVNKAIQKEDGTWEGTGELYGNFNLNEKIGKIIEHGVWENQNYYIIEDCNWFGFGCDQGVVLQNQVTNKEL